MRGAYTGAYLRSLAYRKNYGFRIWDHDSSQHLYFAFNNLTYKQKSKITNRADKTH